MKTSNLKETFEEKQARELEAFIAKQKAQAEERKRRQEARLKELENREVFAKQQKEYIKSYGFSEKQAEMIYNEAWDRGHSCGYNEVRSEVENLTDWVHDFMNAK